MKTTPKKIKINTITQNYQNHQIKGVFGMDGKLNIRPPYQREFVYNDKKRDEVIRTILKKLPLNTMWWSKNTNKTFEVLDGQQRTISILDYINLKYSIIYENKTMYFNSFAPDIQKDILNYELDIYECEGKTSEKLAWFKIINIAGEKLTNQELRNAVYSGVWVENAKLFFSKANAAGIEMSNDFIKGKANRQEILEIAIRWIANFQNTNIENYMSKNQHIDNIQEIREHFSNIIHWIKKTFLVIRKPMKLVPWGELYKKYYKHDLDIRKLNKKIDKLMMDDEVTSKKGIYSYVLTNDKKNLNLRTFNEKIKIEAFEKQNGKCQKCKKLFKREEMEADHIKPWSKGGKTEPNNCQMLCKKCNLTKSNN